MRNFYFCHPFRWCGQGSTPVSTPLSPGILCGEKGLPQTDHSNGIEPVVIGERNLSKSSNRSRRSSILKTSHKDRGKVFESRGRENRARAAFQNELWTKVCSHHSRQRSTVRRLTPIHPSTGATCTATAVPVSIVN